jgi:hypothetical protein
MTACETCWGAAYALARTRGGSQVDHYYALLAANEHRTTTDQPDAEEADRA